MQLQGKDRWDLVELRKKQGETYKEISNDLGLEYSSLRNWLSRNRQRFKNRAVNGKVSAEDISPPRGVPIHEDPNFEPINTIDYSWKKWGKDFLGKDLLPHQLENLDKFEEGFVLLNDPRQHGKSAYCVEPFIIRILCEMQFQNRDMPILYQSHSNRNIVQMVKTVKGSLMSNMTIYDHYGELIDYSRMRYGARKTPQTMKELSLHCLRDPQLISLCGVTIEGGIRGGNYYWVIIDDPVDIKEELNPEKATDDFLLFFQSKIIPLCKGVLIVIGTKYLPEDLYFELKKLRIFKYFKRQAILGSIPSYSLPEDLEEIQPKDLIMEDFNEDDFELLAPSLWAHQPGVPMFNGTPAQNILYKHHLMGERIFQRELMNNAIPRETVIKWDWVQRYRLFPEKVYFLKFCCFVDPASGESAQADYNAFSFIGTYGKKFYIQDLKVGRWSPMNRIKQLENFILENCQKIKLDKTNVRVLIEVVYSSGFDFYALIRDTSWIAPLKWSPSGRGDKEERIMNNLGAELESERVFFHEDCREMIKLKSEIEGFPKSKHEHLLDSIDQGIYFLKRRRGSRPRGGDTSSTFTAKGPKRMDRI